MNTIDDYYSKENGEAPIDSEIAKECVACRRLFVPSGRNASRQKICKRTHYLKCTVCGTEFEVKEVNLKTVPQCCSKKCASIAKHSNSVKTMQNKYGVTNPSQVPEFKAKAAESNKKVAQIADKKRKQTMKERYGAEYPLQSPEIRHKIETTMQAKYGISNPMESSEFRDKISAKLKSDEVRSKYVATSFEHYGVEYPAQSEEVQEKMRHTAFEHFGTEYPSSLKEVSDKTKATCMEKYGVPCNLLRPDLQAKARETLLSKDNKGRISQINQDISNKLTEAGISNKLEFYLDGKWYDIICPDINTLIEIDPSYTHSSVGNHWNKEGVPPSYHLNKTTIAKDNGYRCIHIFDWDDVDKIVNLVAPKKIIYARKCDIAEIEEKVAVDFCNANHIQGSVRGNKVCLGLLYEGNLVQVMTLGKPRYTHKYEWELLRLCTSTQFKVVGGASKLFSYFIKKYSPQSVLSYCDAAKFSGQVYFQLGMELHHATAPAKVWSKGNKYITDNLLRQRGYDALFGTDYGKGTSNEELMLNSNWLPVHDCGQYVFTYFASNLEIPSDSSEIELNK